jgi:hypothetical protein
MLAVKHSASDSMTETRDTDSQARDTTPDREGIIPSKVTGVVLPLKRSRLGFPVGNCTKRPVPVDVESRLNVEEHLFALVDDRRWIEEQQYDDESKVGIEIRIKFALLDKGIMKL